MPAVALTDRANLFGALEFSVSHQGRRRAADRRLRPAGDRRSARARPSAGRATPTVVLLAQNEAGYRNLTELSSAAFLDVDADRRAARALGARWPSTPRG